MDEPIPKFQTTSRFELSQPRDRTVTPIDERDARLAYLTGLIGDVDQAAAADRIIEAARSLNAATIDAAEATRRIAINRLKAQADAAGAVRPTPNPATAALWAEICVLNALRTMHEISLRVRSGEERPR
jgi:hypothetical protein